MLIFCLYSNNWFSDISAFEKHTILLTAFVPLLASLGTQRRQVENKSNAASAWHECSIIQLDLSRVRFEMLVPFLLSPGSPCSPISSGQPFNQSNFHWLFHQKSVKIPNDLLSSLLPQIPNLKETSPLNPPPSNPSRSPSILHLSTVPDMDPARIALVHTREVESSYPSTDLLTGLLGILILNKHCMVSHLKSMRSRSMTPSPCSAPHLHQLQYEHLALVPASRVPGARWAFKLELSRYGQEPWQQHNATSRLTHDIDTHSGNLHL